MYFKKGELVLLVALGLFIAWLLIFGQTVEVGHDGLRVPGTEEYIHDSIIRCWNELWA